MVFWRDSGWKDEDEAVEARDGVCSMTDMVRRADDLVLSGQARPEPAGMQGETALWAGGLQDDAVSENKKGRGGWDGERLEVDRGRRQSNRQPSPLGALRCD